MIYKCIILGIIIHNSNNIVSFTSIFEIIIGFSWLNNMRNYFYIHSCIFLALFFKRNECIFEMKFILLLVKWFKFLEWYNLIYDPKK